MSEWLPETTPRKAEISRSHVGGEKVALARTLLRGTPRFTISPLLVLTPRHEGPFFFTLRAK
ncbi:MAG: hypothetical protein M3O61_05155 [Gemmatimonadota bacterium]|nr:hypothetical protein [Gemmatimonadota bacterium]